MRKTIIALVIMIFLSFCGCTSGESEVKENDNASVVVIVRPGANMPKFSLNSKTIRDTLYETAYTHGSVAYITVEGKPRVVFQTDIPEAEVSGLTETKQTTIANQYTDQLLTELNSIEAMSEEADLIKALLLAQTVLNDKAGSKEIIIMDSGLSTSGYVNFTKGLLQANPDDIVKALNTLYAIPSLNDVNVRWMYFAQTEFPQEELSEKQKYTLKCIWEGILHNAGVNSITFTSDIATEKRTEILPRVSCVEVEEPDSYIEGEKDTPDPLPPWRLDSSSVRFIGNKADFVDADEARASITDLAELLRAHPNNVVYVIGTTASGDKDFCKILSENRADAVIDLLILEGISSDRLIPMGLGFEDPWHINDIENGVQVESLARQNRKTLILDYNDPEAEQLRP